MRVTVYGCDCPRVQFLSRQAFVILGGSLFSGGENLSSWRRVVDCFMTSQLRGYLVVSHLKKHDSFSPGYIQH